MPVEVPACVDEYGPSPIRARINGALKQIKWTLLYLHDVQEIKLPAALQALAAAKQLRRYASALERTLTDAVVAEMRTTGIWVFSGEGFDATLHEGGPRKEWRHDSLGNEVADRCITTLRSRHPNVPGQDVRRLVQEALHTMMTAGRIEWRSTALREMGIDPDEFSTKTQGPTTVELTGDATYAAETYGAPPKEAPAWSS